MSTVVSEFKKIGSVPVTWAVFVCTVVFSVAVSLVFESRFGDQGWVVKHDILKTVPDYIAIGFVALGTILSGQEYQGGQIYTTGTPAASSSPTPPPWPTALTWLWSAAWHPPSTAGGRAPR